MGRGRLTRRRPLIAVTGPDRLGTTAWVFTRWALRRAGAQACRLTPEAPRPPEPLAGLVLGGGADLDPARYGQPQAGARGVDPARDEFEWAILQRCLRAQVPVLGICRGSQLLNVFHGGSLHQDISGELPAVVREYAFLARTVIDIEPRSTLGRIARGPRANVNSLHHQAIDRVGKGLRVTARSKSGIVQALEREGPELVLGVQWHPEYLPFSRIQRRLFHHFVEAARARMSAALAAALEAEAKTAS